jgi:hypothetical protein
MMDGMDPGSFRERALHEALRYGPDPWVFVRELLQNARDAGAHRVDFSVHDTNGRASIVCRDDGCGMSFEHARRYLFALYASSKEGLSGSAGRFGVGFWSVLRFEPERILVRSWPRHGEPWEVELDGALARAVRREAVAPHDGSGTEIILERAAGDGALPRRIADAVWQSARFLSQRDAPGRPLAIRVNGRFMNARFDLPAPSARFERGGLRGAVGLGAFARVELFAKGLRVRSAASLEDLLGPDGRSSQDTRARFPEVAEGLAPQALLDGRDLEVLLARSDARETPALRRLLALARDELSRLVDRQLALVRPEPLWRRAARVARGSAGAACVLALAALAFSAGASWGRRGVRSVLVPGAQSALVRALAVPGPAAFSVPSTADGDQAIRANVPSTTEAPVPYQDLAGLYEGPETDVVSGPRATVALRYSPPDPPLRFAALVVRLAGEAPAADPAVSYDGGPCDANCIDVVLAVAGGGGPLRLPVPTGHRLDPTSVRIGGRRAEVQSSPEGEPLLALVRPTESVVTYRTGPGAPAASAAGATPGSLPEPLGREARSLRSRPVEERVLALTARVSALIAYSNAPEVVARERAAAADGMPFAARALAVGAGDCDVQNGLLALLLAEAGVPARLVVGYQGVGGRALPGLHAWVEYQEREGPWRSADASSIADAAPLRMRRPVAVASAPLLVSSAAAPALPTPGRLVVWRGAAGVVLVLAAALGIGLVALRRTRRDVRLDPAHDPARLLRGALQQPAVFAEVPAIFDRRLVPLVGGGATSLRSAWEDAARGRLLVSRSGSPLARRAARAGASVLDGREEEGRVVSDALGAVDLDAWDALLARAGSHRLLDAAAAALRRRGEPWDLRLADDAAGLTLLELPGRALGLRFRAGRVVVVDVAEGWWAHAARLSQERPCEALLRVVDALADRLALPAARRAALVAPLALAALEEASR